MANSSWRSDAYHLWSVSVLSIFISHQRRMIKGDKWWYQEMIKKEDHGWCRMIMADNDGKIAVCREQTHHIWRCMDVAATSPAYHVCASGFNLSQSPTSWELQWKSLKHDRWKTERAGMGLAWDWPICKRTHRTISVQNMQSGIDHFSTSHWIHWIHWSSQGSPGHHAAICPNGGKCILCCHDLLHLKQP